MCFHKIDIWTFYFFVHIIWINTNIRSWNSWYLGSQTKETFQIPTIYFFVHKTTERQIPISGDGEQYLIFTFSTLVLEFNVQYLMITVTMLITIPRSIINMCLLRKNTFGRSILRPSIVVDCVTFNCDKWNQSTDTR